MQRNALLQDRLAVELKLGRNRGRDGPGGGAEGEKHEIVGVSKSTFRVFGLRPIPHSRIEREHPRGIPGGRFEDRSSFDITRMIRKCSKIDFVRKSVNRTG